MAVIRAPQAAAPPASTEATYHSQTRLSASKEEASTHRGITEPSTTEHLADTIARYLETDTSFSLALPATKNNQSSLTSMDSTTSSQLAIVVGTGRVCSEPSPSQSPWNQHGHTGSTGLSKQ